jgi:hypothetical protein
MLGERMNQNVRDTGIPEGFGGGQPFAAGQRDATVEVPQPFCQ